MTELKLGSDEISWKVLSLANAKVRPARPLTEHLHIPFAHHITLFRSFHNIRILAATLARSTPPSYRLHINIEDERMFVLSECVHLLHKTGSSRISTQKTPNKIRNITWNNSATSQVNNCEQCRRHWVTWATQRLAPTACRQDDISSTNSILFKSDLTIPSHSLSTAS